MESIHLSDCLTGQSGLKNEHNLAAIRGTDKLNICKYYCNIFALVSSQIKPSRFELINVL